MDKNRGVSSVNMIMVVVVLMLVSRVMGLIRDTLIGSNFGASMMTDAYFTSMTLTTGLFLGIGSAIATNTIPYVVRYRKQEKSPLPRLFGAVGISALVLTLVYWFVAPLVVRGYAAGFSAEGLATTLRMTRIILPSIFFVIMTYFFIGILQGNERFGMPAMVSIPFNLLFFLYLFRWALDFGVWGLAVVTTLGWGLQCLFVMTPVIRHKLIRFGVFEKADAQLYRSYFGGLVPIVIVTLTHQLNIMIDNNQATFFQEGSASAIYYGNVLFKAIVTTTVYGITAVMFPKFNSKFIEDDRQGLYQSVINVLRSIVLLLIPMSVGLIVFGQQVIAMIFQRGSFDMADSMTTIMAFTGYTSFMIAFGIMEVLNKAYYTMSNRRIPLMMTGLITVCNVVFSLLLSSRMGFFGIPLGTSLAYYTGALVSLLIFMRKDPTGGWSRIFSTFWRSTAAALIMGGLVYGYGQMVGLSTITGLRDLMLLIGGVGVGVAVYGLMLILVREELVSFNVQRLLKRFR